MTTGQPDIAGALAWARNSRAFFDPILSANHSTATAGAMLSDSLAHGQREMMADALLSICDTTPGAQEILRYIIAGYVGRGEPLPDSLRAFHTRWATGNLAEPKRRGRSECVNLARNAVMIGIVRRLIEDFGLSLSRNPALVVPGQPATAIEVTAEAFSVSPETVLSVVKKYPICSL